MLFGGLLLSLKGERFLLLCALLRCRFAALCALLGGLGALRGFGLAFCFLLQRPLACGFAGGGCRADARNEVEVLAVFNLLAGSAGAVQGAADWERWLWWQRKSTSRASGVVACPVACQPGWLDRLLRLL